MHIYISDRLRKLMLTYPLQPLTKTVNVMADRYVGLLDTNEFSQDLIYMVAFVLRQREQPLSASDIPLLPAMVKRAEPDFDAKELAQLDALDYRGLLALVLKAEVTLNVKPHRQG
jgi:hypothetical protein